MFQGVHATFKAYNLIKALTKFNQASDGENIPTVLEFRKFFDIKPGPEMKFL